jgi:hypothetical protein
MPEKIKKILSGKYPWILSEELDRHTEYPRRRKQACVDEARTRKKRENPMPCILCVALVAHKDHPRKKLGRKIKGKGRSQMWGTSFCFFFLMRKRNKERNNIS